MAANSSSDRLGREVGLEDGEFGILGRGQLATPRRGVCRGRLLALLGLLGEHLEHLVIGEFASLVAGDLGRRDRRQGHPQRARPDLVVGTHRIVQIVLEAGLERGRGGVGHAASLAL